MELWQANKYFEEWFNVPPDFITILVIGVCIVLFIFSLLFKKLRDISPALMLSAGIIGTFWGTFIALSDFQTGAAQDTIDHNAMVTSIPMVLSGMKSAFVTSLIGLLSAFVAKTVFHFLPRDERHPTIDLLREIKYVLIGKNDQGLSSQLIKLREENKEDFTKLDGRLERLAEAISGDNETSVSSQLIELRNENERDFTKLDGRLEGLAEAIQESLVKSINSLIKELKDVITNQLVEQLKATNKLLSEQLNEMLVRIEKMFANEFGNTLRQFNEATQAIKKWQEEHRQHVEELTIAFKLASQGIERIRADCESIPATMETLKNLMGELDERLTAFAEMKKQAEESFPAIKKHLDKIGNDLKESAAGFGELPTIISNVGKEMENSAEKITTASQNMINEIRNADEKYREDIHRTMAVLTTEMGENMVGIAKEMAKVIEETERTKNN